MRFTVDRIDHLVLTCNDLESTALWYQRVLGMERETFGPENRTALRFGGQKINLHQRGAELAPHAAYPTPGSGELCFVAAVSAAEVLAHLHGLGVAVIAGPVECTGALGTMRLVYCRDPDGTLVEIASYLDD